MKRMNSMSLVNWGEYGHDEHFNYFLLEKNLERGLYLCVFNDSGMGNTASFILDSRDSFGPDEPISSFSSPSFINIADEVYFLWIDIGTNKMKFYSPSGNAGVNDGDLIKIYKLD